jgi:hypothetical protein
LSSSVKIEHRIGVKAPAGVVWEILADVPGWTRWSKLYTRASGVIGFGERLKLEVATPGLPPLAIEPVVFEWEPHQLVHWKLTSLGGLLESVRFFEIDALSESGCIFSNGEMFGGLLGPSRRAMKQRGALRQGFTALGESMRDKAEALWRERGEGAT